MPDSDPALQRVWSQKSIPIVVRAGIVCPLLVRLPYAPSNRDWLQEGHRNRPLWVPIYKSWSVPKTWFEEIVRRVLEAFRSVYVIQPVRSTEKCAPACWNALGAHCECSCLGANHGSGQPAGKWHVVSEALAVKIQGREYSCRLLRAQPSLPRSPRP